MALSRYILPSPGTHPSINPRAPILNLRFNFQFIATSRISKHRNFKLPFSARSSYGNDAVEVTSDIEPLLKAIQSFLPGGTWWNLPNDFKQHLDSRTNPVRPITVWESLLRMWKLLDNHHWIIFLAFACLIVAAVSEITMPSILATSVFSAQSGDTTSFYRNARLLFMLCVASGISSGLRSGCFAIADVILVKRIREVLYSAMIFQDIEFFDREDVGGLTSRLGTDCQRLSSVIGKDIHLIVRNTLQGAGALINLLSLSWHFAMSSLLFCFVLAAIFSVYGQYQKLAAKLTQDFAACANQAAEETISLVRTVWVYGTESLELGRHRSWLERIAFISFRESVAYGFSNTSFNILYRSSQAIGASEKVFQLMQLSPSDQFLSKGVQLQSLIGEFQFVDVPVLENLHLSVKANEVVGLSGSGKTTLVNLLLCLYKPTKGQIYVDGFPLQELDIRWFRENLGCVEQEPQLFHMDVESNIIYGCHHDVKQEDIVRAAKLAYAHEYISYLTDGYQTIIDDNLLSGGQKQRIAIARAILRNPAILILDEATSALDSESEHFVKDILGIFKNLDKVKMTVIVIAHRLSTIKAADRIIDMDGGRIFEMGNHTELLQRGGLYSKLMKMQADFLA